MAYLYIKIVHRHLQSNNSHHFKVVHAHSVIQHALILDFYDTKTKAMQNNYYKKSLFMTLQKNKVKVKSLTRNLMLIALLMGAILITMIWSYLSKNGLLIIAPFFAYTVYIIYRILSLWHTHKKIKQQLQSIK